MSPQKLELKKQLQELIKQVNVNLRDMELRFDDDKIDLYEVNQLDVINKQGKHLTKVKRVKTIFGGNDAAMQCYLVGMVQMVHLGKASSDNMMAQMKKADKPMVMPVNDKVN